MRLGVSHISSDFTHTSGSKVLDRGHNRSPVHGNEAGGPGLPHDEGDDEVTNDVGFIRDIITQ